MPSIFWANVRDVFLVIIGFFESFFKLIFWRPNVIFAKGGYVCLPVGLAAGLLRIPLVIHDSDTQPGLTNRILSHWATAIATGAPLEFYDYPKTKTFYTGVPISDRCHPFTKEEKAAVRDKWQLDKDYPLIVITGGGLGAKRLNDTICLIYKKIMEFSSLVLVSGESEYQELKEKLPDNSNRFQLYGFISDDMIGLLGSADLVVARAGATTILELAALAKPTILVPNGQLSGGHQVKNALFYEKNGAVAVVNEKDMLNNSNVLLDGIKKLINSEQNLTNLANNFHKFAKINAAKEVADLIIKSAK